MSLSAFHILRHTGLCDARVYARLGSTNERAAELAERGEIGLPGVVVASLQTAGRGRGENAWHSDAGSLTATFVLPIEAVRAAQELPLRAGMAVRAALSRWIQEERLSIKWPNDVLADGRKIAGVLCRRVRGADLVGIGINVGTDLSRAAPAVRARATTMARMLSQREAQDGRRAAAGRTLTAQAPTRGDVLCELSAAVLAAWECRDWGAAVNRAHALNGRRTVIDADGERLSGVCVGIDERGAIVLDIGGKRRAILNGTVVEWAGR